MMEKIKLAIIGSCPSRDPFNSKFGTGYKNFYEVVMTHFQMSVISSMSEPVEYEEKKLEGVNPAKINEVKSDLEKDLLSNLLKSNPEYIIMDFWADHFFGAIKLSDGKFITNNEWRVKLTQFYKEQQNAEIIEMYKNPEYFLSIWKDSIDKFFQFVQDKLPDTKVIIHKARNVKLYLDDDNVRKELRNAPGIRSIDVDEFNSLWATMDDYVISKYNPYVIDVFNDKFFTHNKHPWGKLYVHYNRQYYLDFLSDLHRVVMDDMQKTIKELKKKEYQFMA